MTDFKGKMRAKESLEKSLSYFFTVTKSQIKIKNHASSRKYYNGFGFRSSCHESRRRYRTTVLEFLSAYEVTVNTEQDKKRRQHSHALYNVEHR